MSKIKIAFLTSILNDIHTMNVGDVFIGKGLLYLLHNVFQSELEIFPISRFGEINKDFVKTCDLVIYAGMPQYNNLDHWCHYYDDKIWDDLIECKVPVLRLAGGGGHCEENWKPEDFANCLVSSSKTFNVLEKARKICKAISVRDPMADAYLSRLNVPHDYLACPGTFACWYYGIHESKKMFNAVGVTAGHIAGHPKKEIIMDELMKTKWFLEKKFNKKTYVLCQVKSSDYEFLRNYFPEDDIIYANSFMQLLEFYQNIDICVTTRLHAALPVFGIGGRPIIIRVDTRATATEKHNIPLVKASEFSCNFVENVVEKDLWSQMVSPTDLFKESMEKYQKFNKIIGG